MRYGTLTVLLAVAWLAPDAAAQTGPSFDCAKATTAIEKAICGDREASVADQKMADAYKRLLGTLTNPAARSHLQRDQVAWLGDRPRICAVPAPPQTGRTLTVCLRDLAGARAERLGTLPSGNAYAFVGERQLIERGRRGGVGYEIAVSYPIFEFHEVDYGRANAAIKGWADRFAADVRPPLQAAPGGVPDLGWFLQSGHAVHVASRELVTVAAHWLVFTGGAHPNNGRVAWHVALTSGQLLRLDDLFDPASGWPEAITRLLRADLATQFNERPGFVESIAPAALRKMALQSTRWIFAADKVTVTFDPYEVGPYAAGPYEVDLSYAALAPYIRKDGPLAGRAR